MKSVYLINGGMDADAFEILSGTCEKEWARRGVKTDARDGYGIRVAVDPSLANDTFRLLPGTDGAAVSGATLSAVFHGVGVLLRRLKPDGRGGFTPLAEAVTFTPVKPLRGMYFATHFGNFYHAAPIEEVLERVVLSAMRGYRDRPDLSCNGHDKRVGAYPRVAPAPRGKTRALRGLIREKQKSNEPNGSSLFLIRRFHFPPPHAAAIPPANAPRL